MDKNHPLSKKYPRYVAAFAVASYALLTAVTAQTEQAQELAAYLMGIR